MLHGALHREAVVVHRALAAGAALVQQPQRGQQPADGREREAAGARAVELLGHLLQRRLALWGEEGGEQAAARRGMAWW